MKNITQKQIVIFILIILIILIVLIAGIILNYIFSPRSQISQFQTPQTRTPPITPPIEEVLQPGTIGETEKSEILGEGSVVELPQVIFNTTGKILQIQSDRIIVQGDGFNFQDQKPRELTLIFTEETLTFEPGQKVKYQGFEGLKHLKIGGEIAISSPENIRGKTQFIVGTINKL